MSATTDDYDTVIIGAGMSGLAAGIRLAYYDQRVCILERHTTIGGLNSFYRLDGRNYDVGLHAVTNYAVRGTKKGPLARLLRQLRMSWDEWPLFPQVGSRVAFPGVSLDFNNDFEFFRSEVHRRFPDQKDNFERLVAQIADYDDLDFTCADRSAREIVSGILSDPLLVEMLFCPLMYYGSAREGDMDFAQFCIMFRSIFMEGLGRPAAGVRLILKTLVRRFRALGGALRLRSGVSRLVVEDATVTRLVLDDGAEITARNVLSSAGWCETMRLCGDTEDTAASMAGQLSFCEAMSVLDCQPRELGHEQTVIFFNDSPEFHWQKATDLVDLRSGVICSPNNFFYDGPPDEGMVRMTMLANFDLWRGLPEPEYRLAKLHWYDRMLASAVRFVPDFRGHVVATDMFTPTTIRRYTGHDNGAVYGAAKKRYDGTTHLKNLFICGTDQGFVGIIGSIVSGISMANQHLLKAEG
ncbi:MAG: phytoene dehydrogenase [Planctomycetia bacterium 21-64-5]|nr:MAG: phytoene dehydrogenase [Planctomycetia bacterium 21-64-5]HQU46820.1 NAD(P)/FAD-dependent oxidoreductase [Pirellulales bacterium]